MRPNNGRSIQDMLRTASLQSGSKLMQLPAELRLVIYEFVLEDQKAFISHRGVPERFGSLVVPGMLLACKIMYHEARPLLFRGTKFYFATQYRLLTWARSLRAEDKAGLARVGVFVPCKWWWDDNRQQKAHEKLPTLKEKTGLGEKLIAKPCCKPCCWFLKSLEA